MCNDNNEISSIHKKSYQYVTISEQFTTRKKLYAESTENFVENMKKKSDKTRLAEMAREYSEINCNAHE